MAIIVDKEKKRRDIALKCKDLIVSKGLKDLTISKLAEEAGIGKGTMYDYFENKEEIVLELVDVLTEQHREQKRKKLEKIISTKEKVKVFFSFFYNADDEEMREIHKHFISIALSQPNEKFNERQTTNLQYYQDWAHSIIQEGIVSNEIKPEGEEVIKSLFAMSIGLFIINITTRSIPDLEIEMNAHIDTIFDLIRKDKE